MMIPTISIDGLSGSVVRDGPGIPLTHAMHLGMLADQNKECGEAFKAAVEKFQQVMADVPDLDAVTVDLHTVVADGGQVVPNVDAGDEAPDYISSAVPHVAVEVPVTAVTSTTVQQVATSATLPLEGVVEKPVEIGRASCRERVSVVV